MKHLPLLLIICTCTFFCSDPAKAQGYWSAPSDSFETGIEALHVTDAGTALVGTFRGMYRSTDAGVTWSTTSNRWSLAFSESDDIIYAAGYEGLLSSVDDGLTWNEILPSETRSVAVEGNTIVAGGAGGQLYRSDDAGVTWVVASCELQPLGYDGSIRSVATDGTAVIYDHNYEATVSLSGDSYSLDPSKGQVYIKSVDGRFLASDGSAIIELSEDLSRTFVSETPFFSTDELEVQGDTWVVASFSGTALSMNAGGDWVDITGNLADNAYGIEIAPDGHLWAFLDYQVQRSREPVTTGTPTERHIEVPTISSVGRPYPMPSAGIVRIPVILAGAGYVDVAVYNMLGQKVETLVAKEMQAGRFILEWDAGRFASGTYSVRLSAGGQVATRQIVLAR